MAADDRLTRAEQDLARELRDAHRRVRSLVVTPEERIRLAKRLLAISEAAKHDIASATTRLAGFVALLDGDFDTPSGG